MSSSSSLVSSGSSSSHGGVLNLLPRTEVFSGAAHYVLEWLEQKRPPEQPEFPLEEGRELAERVLTCLAPVETEEALRELLKGVNWIRVSGLGVLVFARIAGGGQSTVYRGITLPHGTQPPRDCVVKKGDGVAQNAAWLEVLRGAPYIIQAFSADENYLVEESCLKDLNYIHDRIYGIRDSKWVELMKEERIRSRINRGILEGVATIHCHQIIHFDLKLENILLTSEYEPRIVDFGAARKMGDRPGSGSKGYFSPEQLEYLWLIMTSDEELPVINEKVDIWQTGLVLARFNQGFLSAPFQNRILEYVNKHCDAANDSCREAELWVESLRKEKCYGDDEERYNRDFLLSDVSYYLEEVRAYQDEIINERRQMQSNELGLFSDLQPRSLLEELLVKMLSFKSQDRISSQEIIEQIQGKDVF